MYGVDTEFHRERTYFPHLALVQLAWPAGVALVDPLAVDVAALSPLLGGPGLAVAHASEQDLEVLDLACSRVPARLFDTQIAAGFLGLSSPSLASLVDRLLGVRLTKGNRLTDWTRRPLSAGQRSYAASDVAHLLELHRTLVERLDALGRLQWARDECALALGRPHRRPDPDRAWWRLKDARRLHGKERCVAQCVAAWRERSAAAADRPVRFVLPDLALLSICHRPPRSRQDVGSARGMEGRRLAGQALDGLMEALEAARTLDESELQVPPIDSVESDRRPAAALGAAWASQRAAELRLESSLLATRSDVLAFLRGDEGARLATGWRYELLGKDLAHLAGGKALLGVGPTGALVLEERAGAPSVSPEPRRPGGAGRREV